MIHSMKPSYYQFGTQLYLRKNFLSSNFLFRNAQLVWLHMGSVQLSLSLISKPVEFFLRGLWNELRKQTLENERKGFKVVVSMKRKLTSEVMTTILLILHPQHHDWLIDIDISFTRWFPSPRSFMEYMDRNGCRWIPRRPKDRQMVESWIEDSRFLMILMQTL